MSYWVSRDLRSLPIPNTRPPIQPPHPSGGETSLGRAEASSAEASSSSARSRDVDELGVRIHVTSDTTSSDALRASRIGRTQLRNKVWEAIP